MDSSILIPITLWSTSEPVFRISTICISPNYEKLVTGSYSGQMCLWELDLKNEEVTPKNLLIGHKHSVTCLASTNEYVVSSCEGREMYRWNLDDGYCSKMNKSLFIHRKMQVFKRTDNNEELLFTCGDYSEIFVLHPFTLQVIFILNSRNDCDWISSFHVTPSQNNKSDIVSGTTTKGCVKLWVLDELLSGSQFEIDSNTLPTAEVVDLKYNLTRTELLIVSVKHWMLFDSELSNCICRVESHDGERLLGGNFCGFNVVVWTNSGKFYIYNVIKSQQELQCICLDHCNKISVFEPAMSLIQIKEDENYLIRGDSQGKINIWKLNLQKKQLYPAFSVTLKDKWVPTEKGFFNSFINYSTVTCCIYILDMDKFFVGCFDGSIVIIPATQSIKSFYFSSTAVKPSTDILIGHKGKINCLSYPHEKYSHFSKSHLVSGGSDFSVCLWDIFNGELLHKFCVQSGEIISLIVPPEECSNLVKLSICSVSSDHSVAILNLTERQCVILTSRHEFPVVTVHWRPLDDFIIIECFDGTVHVWQMETGHLDRVLDGVKAQEVVYACCEPSSSVPVSNFYINEGTATKNSLKRNLFCVNENATASDFPFVLSGFLTSDKSESQIITCNLEGVTGRFSRPPETVKTEALDCAINQKMYLLTRASNSEAQKKQLTLLEKFKQETGLFQEKFHCEENHNVGSRTEMESAFENDLEFPLSINENALKMIQFFLSLMHFWEVNPSLDEIFTARLGFAKPETMPSFGITSHPGTYSLFLPSSQNSFRTSTSLVATICIAMITLSKILKSSRASFPGEESERETSWRELLSFYELCLGRSEKSTVPKPKVEIFAKAWQTKSPTLRSIVRKALGSSLQALDPKENARLLEFWYKYLPHFKILDKTLAEKVDFENVELKTVALVLFGSIGSDLKFKANDSSCQEDYVYQTCASFVYLMLLPNRQKFRFGSLETIAVDFLGRGYVLWENFLKMEKIIPVLFKMCESFSKSRFDSEEASVPLDKCLTAHNALKSIAVARTAAFMSCLSNEIAQIRSGRGDNLGIENFKGDILSVLIFLLEKTPYIMLLYLNDVVSVIIHCIDFSHLKQENLADLLPAIKKFRQVHHSVASQRIAVGLATGALVVHDLRTGKAHEISGHRDSVSALKFSQDGKFLASYSCYENRLSFWQVLTGIFGLGQVHLKCIKSCQTYRIHDEEIRNHLEIASLTWTDRRSVVLRLCDGTETTFHS